MIDDASETERQRPSIPSVMLSAATTALFSPILAGGSRMFSLRNIEANLRNRRILLTGATFGALQEFIPGRCNLFLNLHGRTFTERIVHYSISATYVVALLTALESVRSSAFKRWPLYLRRGPKQLLIAYPTLWILGESAHQLRSS